MHKRLTCSQGHDWEITLADRFSAVLQAIACPVCGSAAETRLPAPHSPRSVSEAPTELEPEVATQASAATEASYPAVPGYEIEGLLGRGGMGVVYQARQLRLKRVVALKMILRESTGTDLDDVVRFRTEAEAVARLQHPNIVQVFEVGEHGRQPFIALEFVDGGSLAQKLAGTPQPPREAAAVVQALARAMHTAHQAGVIHRDLKPANVLLTKEGTPKVTDFGLAKKLDEEVGQTRTGAIMGTPNYMAPEQASGRTRELGPRTDVYALGALLYEMLTGRVPFKGPSVLETLELVRLTEPVPPSRLQPKLPRDLETICLKCLQKDPLRRYDSAAELGDDLGRFLDGESIRARPVGAGEKLWRWCRRKPVVAGLLVALAAAIAGGLAGVFWQLQRARANLVVAERERDNARKNNRQARRAVGTMLTEVAGVHLNDIPQMEEVRTRLLDQAVASLGELDQQDDSPDAEDRFEAAMIYGMLGDLHKIQRRLPEAESAYRECSARLERLVTDFPDHANYSILLAMQHNGLGQVQDRRGEHLAAEKSFQRARDLLEPFTERADARKHLTDVLSNQATHWQKTGRAPEAKDLYRRALELARPFAADPDATRFDLSRLTLLFNTYSRLLEAEGNRPEAERLWREAIPVLERLHNAYPYNRDYRVQLAMSRANLAVELARQAELLRSEEHFQQADDHSLQALALLEKLASDFPKHVLYRQQLSGCYYQRSRLIGMHAVMFPGARSLSDAEKSLQRSLSLEQELVQEYPHAPDYKKSLAMNYNALGGFKYSERDLDQALAHYSQAIDILEQLRKAHPGVAEYSHLLATSLCNRSETLYVAQRYPEALDSYRQTLPFLQARVDVAPANIDHWDKLLKAATTLALLEQKPEIRQDVLRRAAQEMQAQAQKSPHDPDFRMVRAKVLNDLAYELAKSGRVPEAEQTHRDSIQELEGLRPHFVKRHDLAHLLARGYGEVAVILANRGDLAQAEELARKSFQEFEKLLEKHGHIARYHSDFGHACYQAAYLLHQRGDVKQAQHQYDRSTHHHQLAMKLSPKNLGSHQRLYDQAIHWAQLQLMKQQHAVAADTIEKALRVLSPHQVTFYKSACVLTKCASLAAEDASLDAEKRKEMSQAYEKRVFVLLNEAVRHGFKDVEHLKKDADFDPIRQREEFQKILAALEAK